MRYAKQENSASKVGLVLINNPWGESNQQGFEEWAPKYGLEIVGIEKFNDGDTDISAQLSRLKEGGAETLLLVANAAPGAQMMKSLVRLDWDVPVVSHWGISGGRFPELAGADAASKVTFVQTYSFYGEQSEVGKRVTTLLAQLDVEVLAYDPYCPAEDAATHGVRLVGELPLAALQEKYGLAGPEEILAPVGTANAYDAMHLVALALGTAESLEGPALREAFYNLPTYEGLIKTYEQPFTPDNHDALNEDDYILVQWDGKNIVPINS